MTKNSTISTFEIGVDGFAPMPYVARSAGKARATAWRAYLAYRDVTFGQFLKISTIKKGENIDPVGNRIKVSGELVTQVTSRTNGHYVAFMRDGEDNILFSHPADVEYGPFDEKALATPLAKPDVETDHAPAMAM